MRIAIIIAIVIVIIVGFYFYNKNKQVKIAADASIDSIVANFSPCVSFTQKQYDDALRNARNKCYPNWLIPVVGVGAYSKCMAKAKEAIPAINIC